MALVALHRLGASDERLAGYFEHYRERLEPRRATTGAIGPAAWKECRGTDRRFAEDYVLFFEDELARLGLADLLHAYLPPLIPGLSAAAFHAAIRLAYAVEAGAPGDAAAALAYFADAYLPLGEPTGARSLEEGPVALLRRLADTPALAGKPGRRKLIFEGFADLARDPAFAGVIDWMPAGTPFARLAEAALLLYAGTHDFTALHAVTATHAMRVLAPFAGPPERAARYLFQGLCAAHVSIGTPPLLDAAELARLAAEEPPPWADIEKEATEAQDEHVIKLVYTCREEQAAYGGALYQHVAARKAGLGAGAAR